LSQSTWEPEENLESITEMINEFEKEYGFLKEESETSDSELDQKSKKIKKIESMKEAKCYIGGKSKKRSANGKKRRRDLVEEEKSMDKLSEEMTSLGEKFLESNSKFGNFAEHIPLRIIDHATFTKKGRNQFTEENLPLEDMFFKIEWKPYKNGKTPAPTFFSYNILKQKCPFLVLDYIEKMIKS